MCEGRIREVASCRKRLKWESCRLAFAAILHSPQIYPTTGCIYLEIHNHILWHENSSKMSAIEALYIFDEHKYVSRNTSTSSLHYILIVQLSTLILDHVYTNRPPPAPTLLPLYLQQSSPRPSIIYLPSLNPPIILHSIIQDNLLFLSPSSSDTEPLLVLEFLHRVADALEEFLGSPLLASKIAASYDIVAQVVAEMADAGVVCQGEASALRDVVETGPGVLKNLLGSLGATGSSPALSGSGGVAGPSVLRPQIPQAQSSQGSAIPWRRSNVRHTSNELYVDIVESLSVTIAPSGRPLAAFANGSVVFTAKVSGVPDLLLSLSTGGKGAGMGTRGDQLRRVMERAVFHPCVRLNKWKSEGVLSFVPPDGRFALCGYEADLLGADAPLTSNATNKNSITNLNLPASIEVSTGLGSSGADFEVRVTPSASSATSVAAASLQSNLGRSGTSAFRTAGSTSGDSKNPSLEDLTVHVPLPSAVRNVSDLRASKGEAHWSPVEGYVEWKIPPKEFGPSSAVLRCTIQGPLSDDDEDGKTGSVMNGMTATTYDYDEDSTYQQTQAESALSESNTGGRTSAASRTEKNKELMPTSATLSFNMKGWLASGLKVESLLLDTNKSRGLGADVKPYKGVKYVTVSRKGVEVRC